MKLGPLLNSLYVRALKLYGILILALLAALALAVLAASLGVDGTPGGFRIYGGSPYDHMSSRPWPITAVWILMDVIFKLVAIPLGIAAAVLVLTAVVMRIRDRWPQRS